MCVYLAIICLLSDHVKSNHITSYRVTKVYQTNIVSSYQAISTHERNEFNQHTVILIKMYNLPNIHQQKIKPMRSHVISHAHLPSIQLRSPPTKPNVISILHSSSTNELISDDNNNNDDDDEEDEDDDDHHQNHQQQLLFHPRYRPPSAWYVQGW